MSGFAAGLLGGVGDAWDDKQEKDRLAKQDAILEGMANQRPADMGVRPRQAPFLRGTPPVSNHATPGTLNAYVDATEGAGDYTTLYGHAQRDGGKFAGTDVTKMTLGQLYEFTDPNGPYGQYVKSANPEGVVATPLGRYQIVGTTLRNSAKALGLGDDTVFSTDVQDQMFNHLASSRLSRATDIGGKIKQLRAEWRGFRNVSDDELAAAIAKYEMQGGAIEPRAMGARRPS